MSVLMVSTFPPERCGVAAYAAQSVEALRANGERVRVLTWGEGAGDIRLPQLPRGRRVLDLLPHCGDFERVVLQYMPAFYLDQASRLGELLSRFALARLFRSIQGLEVIVHEQSWYPDHRQLRLPGRVLWRAERRQWLAAPSLCFHNQAAIDTYRSRFHVSGENARLIEHGRDFRPFYSGSREAARRELSIPQDELVFVSVGFITPYKGYELAIDGLAGAPELDCRYFIVGSLHPAASPQDAAYLRNLEQRSAGDSRIRLRDEFVDDVAFDRWIRAADAVLLPYRSSTSSSVLARCHLLGVPAITTRAAGLDAELQPGDQAVGSSHQLAKVFRAWAPGRPVVAHR